MKITLPNSDDGRFVMMRSTLTAGQNDHALGRFFLRTESMEKTGQVYGNFYGEYLTLAAATAERHAAMVALDEAIHVLEAECRDASRSLRRRAGRKLIPSDVLKYYGLPLKGRVAFPRSRALWVQFGVRLQQGDDQARAAGHAGMGNRMALDEALAPAIHALQQFTVADGAQTMAQGAFAETRKEVDAQLREIRRELRFALHHMTAAQKHSFLHAYGLLRNHDKEAEQGEPPASATELDAVGTDAVGTDAVGTDAAGTDATSSELTVDEEAVIEESFADDAGEGTSYAPQVYALANGFDSNGFDSNGHNTNGHVADHAA